MLLFTDTFAKDSSFLSSKHCLLNASLALKDCWHLIEQEEGKVMDRYKPLILKNHLTNFLLQAEREAGVILNSDAIIDNQHEIFFNFKELLEEHFTKQEPVAFYTEKLSLSPKVLSRATEKLSGKTPKQIINERLLLEAKRLLMYDNEAGKNIGYTLGFTEPTNFIKFFRKYTGQTPVAFRKLNLPDNG